MKKFVRIILAAALAAGLSVGTAFSASAMNCVDSPEQKLVETDRLGDSVKYNGYPDFGAKILVSNRTVKTAPLHVKNAEIHSLVVPAGKKLTLRKGAVIDGDLYIEKGGTVAVSGGSLIVNGSLVCDGTLKIGEKGYLGLSAGSRFVVNTTGTFRYDADGIGINSDADYACFGKMTWKYLEDEVAEKICAKPLCVVAESEEDGKFSLVADEDGINGYVSMLTQYGYGNPGSHSTMVSLIMGNGSRIRVKTASGNVQDIAGVRVHYLGLLTDELFGNIPPLY